MKKTKRTISILLTVVMLLGLLPVGMISVGADGAITPDTTWYDESATEYHLQDAADLYGFGTLVNAGYATNDFSGKTVYLDADINMNPNWSASSNTAAPNLWKTGNFHGTFDGQGHTISGLYVTKDSASGGRIGLFRYIANGAVVRNLTIANSKFTTNAQQVGAIAGQTNSDSGAGDGSVDATNVIENVYVGVDVIVENTNGPAGGIVGGMSKNLKVSNSVFAGSVSSKTDYAGGIVAFGNSKTVTIENCVNMGSVMSSNSGKAAGGILGNNNGTTTITNCINLGTVKTSDTNDRSGDILGETKASAGNMTITNCYWTGGTVNKNDVAMNRAYKPGDGTYNENVTLTGGPVTAEKLQTVLTANSFTDWKTAATTGTLATLMPAVATALKLDTMDLYVQKSADGKALRFVAVVRMDEAALADYASLAFNISFAYNGKDDYTIDAAATTTTTVYETIEVDGVTVSANASYGGTYFFVVEINGLDAATATDVVFNVEAVMTHKTNAEANESATGTYTFAKYVAPEV